MLSQERRVNLRQFRKLKDSGDSLTATSRETARDWRTVKKYLDSDPSALALTRASVVHPARVIEHFTDVIDRRPTEELLLKGAVNHERLVANYGFTHSYQRVTMYLAEASPQIAPLSPEMHRRFEVLPGSQAQVDWGDEG